MMQAMKMDQEALKEALRRRDARMEERRKRTNAVLAYWVFALASVLGFVMFATGSGW